MTSRRATGLLAAVVGVAAVSALATASASASFMVGSDLTPGVDPGPKTCPPPGPNCTFLDLSARATNAFQAQSPISGIAVAFNVKAGGAETLTFRFAREVSTAGFPATAHATGPTVTLPSAGTYTIAARTPVQMGDEIGYDTTADRSSADIASCGLGADTFFYSPALVDGVAQTWSAVSDNCERLVNAVVEPDADNDGFGDETQDQCPGVAGTQNGCPPSTSTPATAPPPTKKRCKHRKHHAAAVAKKRCKKHHK